MIFIRNKDNIINLERITRIYKEEVAYTDLQYTEINHDNRR